MVSNDPSVGFKIVISIKYRHLAGMSMWESLNALVIIWVNIILNHIDVPNLLGKNILAWFTDPTSIKYTNTVKYHILLVSKNMWNPEYRLLRELNWKINDIYLFVPTISMQSKIIIQSFALWVTSTLACLKLMLYDTSLDWGELFNPLSILGVKGASHSPATLGGLVAPM